MMILTPPEEIFSRLDRFRKIIAESGFGGALIYQNVDLFYYTGTIQNGALYIPENGDPIFMVIKNIDRAQLESSIEKIVPLKNPVGIRETLGENGYALPKKIGLEMDVIPARLYERLRTTLECELGDISREIRWQRARKSGFELKMLKEAASIVKKAFDSIPGFMHDGITETEISAMIEENLRLNGHQGVVRLRAFSMELYAAHVSFGPSASNPVHFDGPVGIKGLYPAAPQIGGDRKLKPGEPVLADIVAGYAGYMVDCTRTYALKSLNEHFMKTYEDILKLNREIANLMKPGAIPSEIYAMALEMAGQMGYADSFMASGENQVKFVGHGIGLEVDEFPVLARGFNSPLEEGNVIALEPKIISADSGGVGIENTYYIDDHGAENITGFSTDLVIVG